MSDAKPYYTVAKAAELTGVSENALRKRMDRGKLGCFEQTLKGRRQRLIPHHALMAAGLLEPKPTRQEKGAQRLVTYLRLRPEKPFSTWKLAAQSRLSRQACEAAMGALLALKYVRKSYEPPPAGTGRPRVVWRWIKPE